MEYLTMSDTDLEEIWGVEARVHYTNNLDVRCIVNDFFNDAFDQDVAVLGDHTVAVTGFPPEKFVITDDDGIDDDDDIHDPVRSILYKTKEIYFKQSRLLILSQYGAPHGAAAASFDMLLSRKLDNTKCSEQLRPYGRATHEWENVSLDPDNSWSPKIGLKHVSFTLEAALSEWSTALTASAKIWLEHPESYVEHVVTIKISPKKPEIIFSLWKRAQGRETRAHSSRRARVDQEMCVTLVDNEPKANGTLCLSFEQFFKRKPRPRTAEQDKVFSTKELCNIASHVWEDQKFCSWKPKT
jgi:hypothetical protein